LEGFEWSRPSSPGLRSGARLLLIPTQGGDLGAQLIGALQITTGEGYSEGELQLFELVVTFFLGVAA
jgi:hypothetical protein